MSGATQMAGGQLLSRQEEVSYDFPRPQFPSHKWRNSRCTKLVRRAFRAGGILGAL